RGAVVPKANDVLGHRRSLLYPSLGGSPLTIRTKDCHGNRHPASRERTAALPHRRNPASPGRGRSWRCVTAPLPEVRLFRPRRAHVIRGLNETGLDTHDHALPDLESLQQRPGLRLAEHRTLRRAVGQLVLIQHALVIDEPARHGDTALFIDQEEIPIAYALIEQIAPGLESLLDLGELHAVLVALYHLNTCVPSQS